MPILASTSETVRKVNEKIRPQIKCNVVSVQ